jgi:hypothetical protein
MKSVNVDVRMNGNGISVGGRSRVAGRGKKQEEGMRHEMKLEALGFWL